jgi:hypothetical protein
MAIWVQVPSTHRVSAPTGPGTGTIFYLWVAPVPDPNRDGYGAGTPTGSRYFTSAMILGCEQVKMCSFVILTMTCSDCWTLLLGYLKYLLNINFEYVYVVFYSLNWLFWCGFYIWNDKPDGYLIPAWNLMGTGTNFYLWVWVWVRISTHGLFANVWVIALPDPLPSLPKHRLCPESAQPASYSLSPQSWPNSSPDPRGGGGLTQLDPT